MSSTTVAAPLRTHRGRRIFLRILVLLLLLAALAAAALTGWFYHATHAVLPQVDGSVRADGIQSPVTVVRDTEGVPHITAASLHDLFFAQGYVTAQDRLWQMDMTRRSVAGELAEILPRSGGDWLEHDRNQRILRLRETSKRVASQLSERDRAFFQAYADGVNAFIAQHADSLPIEFRILGYKPRPWTIADSVMAGLGMSQILNPQYEMEYFRERMSHLLPPDLMADLYPPSSWRDHAPGADPRLSSARDVPAPWSPPPSERDDCEACLPGSNNWVVSGAHTASGRPLLSNDMHLGHRVPGTWYEIQLRAAEFDVEGFSLPGLPFVIVGHNQRIAWGFTNLNPDVQDLFIEDFNSAGEYRTPKGWEKPQVEHEVIHVKGAPDVIQNITITRHGPIVTSLLPGETRQVALDWLIYDNHAVGIPLFDLDSARNWQEFRSALSHFATPSQNVVYADVDGNIGYQAMGFVPVRASGDGTVPVLGADGAHDWTGYLDFSKMPSVYNPPSGIIATANSRITPDGYPYLIATQWYPPYRVERIYKLLNSGKKFTAADMLAIQTDITSDYDRFFCDRFVYAIDHTPRAGARVREAADLMRGFDGRMSTDAVAPVIEINARRQLWRLLLQPRLGDAWRDYQWSESAVALESIVQNQPERWLPSSYGNFNELMTAAVEAALRNAPRDLKSWKYGQQFPLDFNHPLFGAIPVLRRWAGPGWHEQAGGSYTVKQVGRTFGPSERMTVDFSDLDSSTFNILLGESGQIFSPHYMDQWPAWYGNHTFKLSFSPGAVEAEARHRLTLMPAGR